MAEPGPPPFKDLGKKAEDLLTKNYFFNLQRLIISILRSNGTVLTAAARIKNGQSFLGVSSTMHKIGNIDNYVNVDTMSNIRTKLILNNVWLFSKASLSFNFNLSGQKPGKFHPPISTLQVQYLHHYAAIDSIIGLDRTPHPYLELSATIGSRKLFVGGELGFDTASRSCYKYNAGIGFNQSDLAVALLLVNKGQTLKASYIHSVNLFTCVGAEVIHSFSTPATNISIGTLHIVDPLTLVKTRFSVDGKVQMLCQHEWRPKSFIRFAAEHDLKARNAPTRFGLALTLRP